MGTGYTRTDVTNNIATGNIINAADLDNEYDAIEAAFNSSTGHTHDGTAAEGGAITVVGPVQDLVVSATEVKPKTTNTLDLGTSALLYKDAYLQGNMYFRDTALKIVSSADGQLDIDADVELEVVAPTVDIDASTAVTIDTATLTITGSANVVGDLDVDNININGNTIISTDTNGNIALTPNGTGEVDISKVDIDSGAIDGTVIGANSAAAITGTTITGTSFVSSGDMTFGDNNKAIFGAGSDLQIYHTGSTSYIYEQGTGDLRIRGSQVRIEDDDGSTIALFKEDAGVELRYDGAVKLESTATGVDVTGTITSDGLTVDGTTDGSGITAGLVSGQNVEVGLDRWTGSGSDFHQWQLYTDVSDLQIRNVYNDVKGAAFTTRVDFANNGDISFYDDTGTNPSFVYDASGALVVNEDSRDFDFRVESNGQTHMLFVDASLNRVGIGTSTVDEVLHVEQTSGTTLIKTEVGAGSVVGFEIEKTGATNQRWRIADGVLANGQLEIYDQTNSRSIFNADSTEIVINESSANLDFRVESDGNTHALFVDGGNNQVVVGTSTPITGIGAVMTLGGGFDTRLAIDGSSSSGLYLSDSGAQGITIRNASGDLEFYGVASGEVVFNEGSIDTDFRIESDTSTHAFFLDAGNNVIGTGTSSPATYVGTGGLAIKGATVSDLSLVSSSIAAGNNSHQIRYYNDTGTAYEIARTRVNVGAGQVNRGEYQFAVNNGAGLRQWLDVNYNGDVVFNQQGYDSDFRVESDTNTHALFVDAANSTVSIGASQSLGTLGVYSNVDGTEAAPHFNIQGAVSSYRLSMWLDATAAYIGQDSSIRDLRLYSSAETAGVSLAPGGTSWGTFSDERLKQNVEPVENALQSLSGLRTVKYHLKDVDGPEDKKKIGVIAQDLVGVLDEVIDPTFRPDDDTEYMGVRYTELVPVLIKAIQEQQTLIETLEARITALEAN